MVTSIPAELPSWLVDDYDDDLSRWSLVVCSLDDDVRRFVNIDSELRSRLATIGVTDIAVVVMTESRDIVSEIALKLPLGDPDVLKPLVDEQLIRAYSSVSLEDSDGNSRWMFAGIPERGIAASDD